MLGQARHRHAGCRCRINCTLDRLAVPPSAGFHQAWTPRRYICCPPQATCPTQATSPQANATRTQTKGQSRLSISRFSTVNVCVLPLLPARRRRPVKTTGAPSWTYSAYGVRRFTARAASTGAMPNKASPCQLSLISPSGPRSSRSRSLQLPRPDRESPPLKMRHQHKVALMLLACSNMFPLQHVRACKHG